MSFQTHLNAIAFYTKSFETKIPRTKDCFMYDAVSKSLECHCLVCNQEIICVAVYQIKQCVGKTARRVAVVHWCVLRASEFDRLATCHCDYSPDAVKGHPTHFFSEAAF